MDNKNPFPFCDNKTKTIKENIICEQHKMHNAMTDNTYHLFCFMFLQFFS